MNYTIHTIDNLFNSQAVDKFIPEFVYNTIINSKLEQGHTVYKKEDMDAWLSRRSLQEVEKGIQNKFFAYIKESNGDISAFAAINKSNGKYYYSWLQVLPQYRGKGYAKILSDLRDQYIQLRGVKEITIESLKFENTLKYHEKRGFKYHDNQEGLTETVRMTLNF